MHCRFAAGVVDCRAAGWRLRVRTAAPGAGRSTAPLRSRTVFFLVFGSSGAGKTSALVALRSQRPELAVHDFDEIGVPSDVDIGWRHQANERWVHRALDYQAAGVDMVLAGQTPLGELLAAPSAAQLEAISACLLDCDDETRVTRLRERGEEWLERAPGDLQDFVHWAEWMRRHAADPAWRQDVIRAGDAAADMRWERWTDWRRGDPRWRVRVIDTSRASVERVAAELSAWVQDERALFRARTHPLTGRAAGTQV